MMTTKRKIVQRWNEAKDPLLQPFVHGFRREIVLRGDKARSRTAGDVYYYTKKGDKLKSMRDVSSYVGKHGGMGLTEVNFTFCRCAIYNPPDEVVRKARPWTSDKSMGQCKEAKMGYVDDSILSSRNYGVLFKHSMMGRAELVVSVERLPLPLSQSWKNGSNGMEHIGKRPAFSKSVTDTSRDMNAPKVMSKDKVHGERKLPGNMATTTSKGQCKEAKMGYVDDSIISYGDYGVLFQHSMMGRAELVVSVERLTLPLSQSWKNGSNGMEHTDKRPAFSRSVTDTSRDMNAPKVVSKDKAHSERKLPGNMATTTSKAKSKHHSSSLQILRFPGKVKKGHQRSIVSYINISQREGKQMQVQKLDENSTTTTVPQEVRQPEAEQHAAQTGTTKLDCDAKASHMTLNQKVVLSTLGDTTDDFTMRRGECVNSMTLPRKSRPPGTHSGSAKALLGGGQKSADVRELLQVEGQKKNLAQKKCHTEKLLHKENKKSQSHKSNGSYLQKNGRKASVKTTILTEKTKNNSSLTLKKKVKEAINVPALSDSEDVSKKEEWSVDYSSALHVLQEGSLKLKLYKRKTLEDLAHTKEQKKPEKIRKLKTSESPCKNLPLVSHKGDGENVKSSCILDKHATSVTTNNKPSGQPKAKKEDDFFVKSHLSPQKCTSAEFSEIRAASQACLTQDEYKEDWPQSNAVKLQLHTTNYAPSPKKDWTQSYTPGGGREALYTPGSKAYVATLLSRSHSTAVRFEEEIKSSRNVKELDDEHIKYLFYKCMPEMQGIVDKRICSWRNDDYHKGGKAKRMLTYKVYSSAFSNEQIDLISDMFIDEYVMRRNVTGDYLNQVLLPEFLIRVYMATNGTTHEESDMLMAATPVSLFDVPTYL